MNQQLALDPAANLGPAVAQLRSDLLLPGGPRISTMTNYNFAIVVYKPEDEFSLRQQVHDLAEELRDDGWAVRSIELQSLLFERLRQLGEDNLQSVVELERKLHEQNLERSLKYLKSKISPILEGPDGLAADVVRIVTEHLRTSPEHEGRRVVFVGRIGALYPFFRSSALLKHINGRTHNIPVVLLYPGVYENGALSFMGRLAPDRDYRPRIYA